MMYEWDRIQQRNAASQVRREQLAEAKLSIAHDELVAGMDLVDRKRLRHERKYRKTQVRRPASLSIGPCGLGG